jgi:hypothetical protein
MKEIEQVLNKKQMKFIEYRMKGLSVQDAYKLAGYTGNTEQAYQLSHKVKNKVTALIEEDGYNKNAFMGQMVELLKLPLKRVDNLGRQTGDVDFLTVEEKLKVLRLFKDTLPEIQKAQNTIPRFQIFIGDSGTSVNMQSVPPVESTVTNKTGSIVDVLPLDDEMDQEEQEPVETDSGHISDDVAKDNQTDLTE